VVIGVNKYKMEEEQKIPLYKINPETARIQKDRDVSYKGSRDPEKLRGAMKALEETLVRFKDGEKDHQLIPRMIEAARSGATSGEMMALMKTTLGWLSSAVVAPC
jgi:methylmalonyl-CoA mutase N-terminal domain/subunit